MLHVLHAEHPSKRLIFSSFAIVAGERIRYWSRDLHLARAEILVSSCAGSWDQAVSIVVHVCAIRGLARLAFWSGSPLFAFAAHRGLREIVEIRWWGLVVAEFVVGKENVVILVMPFVMKVHVWSVKRWQLCNVIVEVIVHSCHVVLRGLIVV